MRVGPAAIIRALFATLPWPERYGLIRELDGGLKRPPCRACGFPVFLNSTRKGDDNGDEE